MKTLGQIFANELEMELRSSRACLEKMQENLYEYKPHEKSMQMGYLALLVADIPKWITAIVKDGVVDFATWEHDKARTAEELVALFDKNIAEALETLKQTPDEAFSEMFYLKSNGQELSKDNKENSVSSSINHLVHHRGQLTVYMRLNDIAVPSIYGPSADDKSF